MTSNELFVSRPAASPLQGGLFDDPPSPAEPVQDAERTLKDSIPHIIKYMGSKKPILDFVIPAIREIHQKNQPVCDLFAGSCSISAALRKECDFISNDIQDYSRILAHTYFSDLSGYDYATTIKEIDEYAKDHVDQFKTRFPKLFFSYSEISTLAHYQHIEQLQRDMIDAIFDGRYYLFTKYYSGTYWSFEQCAWIDALRITANRWLHTPVYYAILASIMYGMSYTSQSTGHFAQYRDGNSQEAMENIIYYREKDIYELFKKKLQELMATLDNSLKRLYTSTLDFTACLTRVPRTSTVYADPPYAPVHYSRFYHALETLVKYDYPTLDHKARYRADRHQSPFSQKTNAPDAFDRLFEGIVSQNCQMVLSYSDNAVVDIGWVQETARKIFPVKRYEIEIRNLEHRHSTMGRFEDHERDVTEYLIIAKFT